MGRDDIDTEEGQKNIVSIHAPAWGATRFCFSICFSKNSFNPRARMGRDGLKAPAKPP